MLRKAYVKIIMALFLIIPLFLAAQDPMQIAVMDFKNLTGQADLQFLAEAVPEILITDLSISTQLVIVERDRLEQLLREMQLSLSGVIDTSTAAEIGAMLGAESILTGSILYAGDRYRIDARLIEVQSSAVVLAEKYEWESDDEIITAVDRLAEQIIHRLTGEQVVLVEDPQTESPEMAGDQSIFMETSLSNSYWEAGSQEPVYLQVDLFAREVEQENRLPLNIALVIDQSGSMGSERKLEYAKRAASFVVQNLTASDRLALIAYETDVHPIVTSQPVQYKDHFLRRILDLRPAGSTNLSGGMLEGYAQVGEALAAGQVNRILVLSDGLANRGITDPMLLQNICKEKVTSGISLSAFGVGLDYNEDLMLALAEYGNGNYYFIASPEKIPAIFSNELRGLLAVGAQNVTLWVDIPAEVKLLDTYGYLYERQGNRVRISLGDVFSNERRKILLQLQPPSDYSGTEGFADVSLVYDDVISGGTRREEKSELDLQPTSDRELIERHRNPGVGHSVTLLQSTVFMQKAIHLVDEGRVESAKDFLREKALALSQNAAVSKSQELKKQLLSVHRYQQSLELLEEMPSAARESMQKEQKFKQYQLQKTKPAETQKYPKTRPQPAPDSSHQSSSPPESSNQYRRSGATAPQRYPTAPGAVRRTVPRRIENPPAAVPEKIESSKERAASTPSPSSTSKKSAGKRSSSSSSKKVSTSRDGTPSSPALTAPKPASKVKKPVPQPRKRLLRKKAASQKSKADSKENPPKKSEPKQSKPKPQSSAKAEADIPKSD